jgi:mono/diheme cytochrome c family protein
MTRFMASVPGVLCLALVLCGCGGSSQTTTGPSGRALFAHDCGACHSLTGVEDPKRQGGDLLHGRFSRKVLLQFTREMPVRHRLSEDELRRVAEYVLSVEHSSR